MLYPLIDAGALDEDPGCGPTEWPPPDQDPAASGNFTSGARGSDSIAAAVDRPTVRSAAVSG